MHGIHLEPSADRVQEVDALAESLGGRVGVAGVLGDLGRQARPSWTGRLLGRAVDTAYRWDPRDERDPDWWPQGISSSADADASGLVAGRRLIATTWYARDRGGSRLTLLDLATLRYEHVLLVRVTRDGSGAPRTDPLRVHAGGLVWCGPHLHVAATAHGLATCRVDDVLRAPGHLAASGHRFLLPVRHDWRARTAPGQEPLRYSFLSLDRSSEPPALLAGEYGRRGATTRLARFALTRTGLPRTDDDGCAHPLALDDLGQPRTQGVVVARGRHHLTVSHGRRCPGSVHVGRPGDLREHPLAVPMGPEDLTYWPGTDRLWSLTEHPGRRWVVSMRRGRFG